MKIRFIALLSVLPLFALGTTASAQADLTCDDITFTFEVTSRYPDAKNACIDVVELNGERFAKMSIELLRTGPNSATFRFMHPDGSFGPTQTARDMDPNWRADIGGREYRIRELSRGQQLNIYLPADRWEAHIAPTTAVFITFYPVAMYDDDGGVMASLPSTASSMPLLGLLGGAALLTAFLMRIFRRRLR